MKTRKLIYLIFITFCLIFSLNAEENSVQDIREMAIINSAVNSDNSLMLINTASYEDWSCAIYACNPGKGNLNWGFQKIWDKSKISGCIRTLIYSPFSEKFYFLVSWSSDKGDSNEQYNGLYQIDTKRYGKNAGSLRIEKCEEIYGLGGFVSNKKGVWLLLDRWEDGSKYDWGYGELLQIEDEGNLNNYEVTRSVSTNQFMSYYRIENFRTENEDLKNHAYDISYILQTTDYTLLIKDKDNRSWWNYNCVTKHEKKYATLEEAKLAGQQFDLKYLKKLKRKEYHFVLILSIIAFSCLITIVFICMLIFTKKRIKKEKKNAVKERNRMTFEIQEKERAKISRDIHDSVVQDIRVIRLETENLVVDEGSKSKQNKIEDIATDCIVKLRNICYNLTPAELTIHNQGESSKFELISIINSLVQQFSSRTHFPCIFKVEEGFEYPVLEKEATQNIFRVVQEALNNIEKHSYATQASIFIKEENNILQIYITDDGIGCNQDELQKKLHKKEHLGLRSMLDRMELIGGSVEFFTSQDDGMEVKISLPLRNTPTDTE